MSATRPSKYEDLFAEIQTQQITMQWAIETLGEMAKKLRETAAGLDDGTIHKSHAANRLRKMARGIDGGK